MRTAVDDKKRPRGSSHHLSSHKVIVHQPKHISFSKKGRTSQYQTKKDLREVIYDLFNDYALDTDADRLEFVSSLEKDILQGDKRFHKGAVEKQWASLPTIGERNALVKLLTHKTLDNTVSLNEDTLALFPLMRHRSMTLLDQPERKERSDKINLNVVNRYMHDYCR